MNPSNWHDADTFLHTRGRPVDRKKAANNTYLVRIPGTQHIGVMLHKTCVVTFLAPGESFGEMIILNTGGWFTVTTKERINRFLPPGLSVASVKGRWFVFDRQRRDPSGVARTWPFQDGMTLSREALGWMTDVAATDNDDEVTSKINRFVRSWTSDDFLTDDEDAPEGRAAVLAMLDASPRKLPREFLIDALTDRGYRYPELIVRHRDMCKRALRRYLKAQLLTSSEGARPIAV